MAYFPYICVDCHVELKFIGTKDEWIRKCPICDGDRGEVDHWVKHKELDRENLSLLRFMKGKCPNPDK